MIWPGSRFELKFRQCVQLGGLLPNTKCGQADGQAFELEAVLFDHHSEEHLAVSCIRELAVCWNDSFRKIFGYRRHESVKLLQCYCCWKLISLTSKKCPVVGLLIRMLPELLTSIHELTLCLHFCIVEVWPVPKCYVVQGPPRCIAKCNGIMETESAVLRCDTYCLTVGRLCPVADLS